MHSLNSLLRFRLPSQKLTALTGIKLNSTIKYSTESRHGMMQFIRRGYLRLSTNCGASEGPFTLAHIILPTR